MYSETYVPKYAFDRAFDSTRTGHCELHVLDASSTICNEYSVIERGMDEGEGGGGTGIGNKRMHIQRTEWAQPMPSVTNTQGNGAWLLRGQWKLMLPLLYCSLRGNE